MIYDKIIQALKGNKEHKKVSSHEYDVDKAWTKVYNKTFGHTSQPRFRLSSLLRYAAVGLVFFLSSSALYYLFQKEPNIQSVDFATVNQPTLVRANGKQIALNTNDFKLDEEDDVSIHNKVGVELSFASTASVDQNQSESEHVEEAMNCLLVPHGMTYKLRLSDGTQVCLNSESQIWFPEVFTDSVRKVKLVGEAFFEVRKDVDRPFIVEMNSADLYVLGTAFNVSNYKDDTVFSATLVNGSIALAVNGKMEKPVLPSEQFNYNKSTNTVERQIVDTELYTSWVNGVYIFKNKPLKEILTKLQRWHTFTIECDDVTILDKPYTLKVDRQTELSTLLEMINYTSDVKLVQTENHQIHIRREGGTRQ